MQPDCVTLSKDRHSIKLVYGNDRLTIAAGILWKNARAARPLAATIAGTRNCPPAGLTITSVQTVGRYGLNIAFSDGTARAIYPWSYLNELAAKEQGIETDMPQSLNPGVEVCL